MSDGEGEVNCIICMEVYEESAHSPRTLRCGHTLCAPCLNALLDRPPAQRSCPECRHPIKITAVEHVPISYTILRLARALEQERLVGTGIAPVESCGTHARPLSARCSKSYAWVCPKCQCHPGCQCLVPLTEALLSLKQFKVTETENKVKELEEVKKLLVKKQESLNKQLEEVAKDLNRYSQVVSALEESEARVVTAGTPTNYTRAVTSHTNTIAEANLFINAHPNDEVQARAKSPSPIISPATPSPSPPLNTVISLQALKAKLEVSHHMWAERDVGGLKKYARLTVRGADLLLHPLQDTPPTSDATFVSFDGLRNVWGESQPQQRAFLELAIDGRREGIVEILLFHRSVRAETFVDLCVNENGYTYKGSRINYEPVDSGSINQMVAGEDFVGNPGQLHPSAPFHANQYTDGGYYRRQVFPGLVTGAPANSLSLLTTFRIHIYHSKGKQDTAGFGKVESGLGLVRYADSRAREGMIHDCGLLFRLYDSHKIK